MKELAIADFALPSTGNTTFKLSDQRGKNVVVYFYPKDNTPGCTVEGQEFRDLHPDFQQTDTVVVGVSRDSLKSHEGFKTAQGFPFELLSDTEGTLCERFGVMKQKNMYGKLVRGVERSTFVFDKTGQLVKSWRGLKAPGHAAEVLAFVQTL
jgi:peroxiredoxin Q/BCP